MDEEKKRKSSEVDDLDALLSLPYDFRMFFDEKEESGVFVLCPPRKNAKIH